MPRATVGSLLLLLCLVMALPVSGRRGRLADISNQYYRLLCSRLHPDKELTHFAGSLGRISAFQDKELRFVIFTADYAKPRGYRGPSNLAVTLRADGTVVHVDYVASADTPRWVKRVLDAGFLQHFRGRKAEETETIAAVTGATRTCTAMGRSVAQAVAKSAPLRRALVLIGGRLAIEENDLDLRPLPD